MKRNVLARIANRILHVLARTLPGSTTVRPFLHRLRGVKISGRVFIGDDVYLENEYPDHVEIHDGAQIALRTTIVAHIRGPGRIVIGRNVVIGFGSHVVGAPGRTLTIGDNAVIAAGSTITTDVPPNTFLSGERLKARGYITVPLTLDTSYEAFTKGLRPLSHRPRPDHE